MSDTGCVSGVNDMSDVSNVSDVSSVSDMSNVSDISNVSGVSDVNDGSDISNVSDVSNVSNGPKKRKLTCIICPLGCEIDACMTDDGKVEVSGNICKRGFEYAATEMLNPTRVLTTTVRVYNGVMPLASVKTDKAVPKGMIFDFMKAINTVRADAPVSVGDVLATGLLGTDVNIVATRSVERKTDGTSA